MLKLYYHCIPSTGTWALQFTKDGPVFLIPDDIINQYPVPLTDTHVDVEAGKIPIRCINTKYVSYGIDYDSIIYYKTKKEFADYIKERYIDTQYINTMLNDQIHLYIQQTKKYTEFVLFDEGHKIDAILSDYEVDALLRHPHIKVQLVKFREESERRIVIHLYSKSKSPNIHDKNYVSLEIGGKTTSLIPMKNAYQFVQMLNFMTYKSYLPISIEPIPDDFDEIDCIEWCKLNTPFYRRIFLDTKYESYVDITPAQLSHLFSISSASYMEWMFKQTDGVEIIGDII